MDQLDLYRRIARLEDRIERLETLEPPDIPIYGRMSQYDTAQTVNINDTFTFWDITGWSIGTVKNMEGYSNTYLRSPNYSGRYWVSYYVSFHMATGSNQQVEFAVVNNGNALTGTSAHRTINTASSIGNAAGNGFVLVGANHSVGLAAKNESSTANVIIDHAGFIMYRVAKA